MVKYKVSMPWIDFSIECLTATMAITYFGSLLKDEEVEEVANNIFLQLDMLNFEVGIVDKFKFKDITVERIKEC